MIKYFNSGLSALFLAILLISFSSLISAQSSPSKVQMDPDWEKIRDAQVQMLRKKEAELDRMKEELLLNAQPQAQSRTGIPEIEAEMKKRETVWLQKNENEITLLKIKVGEQKKEIHDLRFQIESIKKNQPAVSKKNTSTADDPQVGEERIVALSQELKRVENQLQSVSQNLAEKEKSFAQLQNEKANIESRVREASVEIQRLQAAAADQDKALSQSRLSLNLVQVEIEKQKQAQRVVETQMNQKWVFENNQLKQELSNAITQRQELEDERQDWSAEKQAMQARDKADKASFESAKIRALAEIERLEVALREQENETKQASVQAQAELDRIKNEHGLFQGQMEKKAAEEKIRVQKEKDVLQFQHQALEREKQSLVAQHQGSLSQAEKEKGALQTLNQKATAQMETLSSELKVKTNEAEQIQNNLNLARTDFENQKKQFNSSINQLEQKLTTENEKLEKENKTLIGQTRELQGKYLSLSAEKSNLLIHSQAAATQFQNSQKEVGELKQRFEDEISALKHQQQVEKDAAKQLEVKWAQAEKNGLQAASQKQARETDFGQKEARWKSKVEELTQKLSSKENELNTAELKIRQVSTQTSERNEAREKDWNHKFADLTNQKNGLDAFEMQLNKKNSELLARSLQLDEKSQMLNHEQKRLEAQAEKYAEADGQVSNRELSELKQKLQQSEFENQSWRRDKWQVEKSWGEFVSQKTEYEMEIDYLNKQNQALQQKLGTSKPAAPPTARARRNLVRH